jgi:hypothetical protein
MPHKKHNPRNVSSAPELPTELAKKFGLHYEGATPKNDQSVVEDPRTDDAVEDIVSQESDELLAVHDATQSNSMPPQKRGFWRSIGHFFAAWWGNVWARWATIIILIAGLTVVALIPQARYAVLNTAGVRSSASIRVLDNTTQLPLKSVTVMLNGKKAYTDREGVAQFKDLKLGDYTLAVKRLAFAGYEQKVTIGWGSNPFGTVKLRATGIQYTILITDYVSGRPVVGAEVLSDKANALSDKAGKAILTVDEVEVTKLSIAISSPGFRGETIHLDATSSVSNTVVLVPDSKDVFVSKQSGRYDVFAVDLDGKNRKLLLAGTGHENTNMSLVVSPEGDRAAFVSTRDNRRDKDGYLLSGLTIIDLKDGTKVTVDHAEQIQLIDWIGNRLIYRTTVAGASAADPQRNRLVAYNYDTNARAQLATANQFNAILSAKGMIYYGVSSTDPEASLGLFKVKPDGSSRKQLFSEEVWTGLRSTYNTLSVQTPTGWYSFTIQDERFSKITTPENLVNYLFVEDPKGKRNAWVDIRAGKGTLLLYELEQDKHVTLQAQEGLASPVRWAGDKAIIYRVANRLETADYVTSPQGGTAKKITDITAVHGYSQAY